MSKIPAATRPAHPRATRAGDWLPAHLAPTAARIVGTIRDYDLADVHRILRKVDDDQRDDLVLLLAAMVDPDQTPADLLAWTTRPAQSRDGLERPGTVPSMTGRVTCPDCGKTVRRDHLQRHRGKRQCKPASSRAA